MTAPVTPEQLAAWQMRTGGDPSDLAEINDVETKRLRALIERPERAYLWGQPYTVTPRLIAQVFGDGQKLVCITPLDGRPAYFVARVDSSITDITAPFPPSAPVEFDLRDQIIEAAEDEYGRHHDDEEEERSFPWGVDWGNDTTWGRAVPGHRVEADTASAHRTAADARPVAPSGPSMISQWKEVGCSIHSHESISYRLDINNFVTSAAVFGDYDGKTWRAKVATLGRDGFASAAEACRWAEDVLRIGLKEALDDLEDVKVEMEVEMLNQHKPSRENVITEG